MSSTVHCVKVKEEPPVAPDSTTADRQCFSVGEFVLHHQEDGLFYFGTIVKIDESNEKGLIQFPDETSQWSSFRDIKKVKQQEETDISCILCKSIQSVANNQILLCHYCRRGYHQNCHQPPIPMEFADVETHWMCTKCMERRQLRERASTVNKRKGGSNPTLNNNTSKHISSGKRRSLPYDLANLKWDSLHLMNKEQKYCYCGENGEWCQMLQCCKCVQWFHQECISVLKLPILIGDRFFLFLCSVCSENGEERLLRLTEELTLADIAHLVLYNLKVETGRMYHDLDLSVLPFLESKWKQLQPSRDILSLSQNDRRSKMLSCFWQYQNRFMCGREMKKKKTMWGLRVPTPPPFPSTLSPNSLRILRQWTNSDVVRITSHATDTSSFSALKKQTNRIGKKRIRSPLCAPEPNEEGENRRKLRTRQQRVSSEGSFAEEESSDDVKQRPLVTLRHSKRSSRSEYNSGSNSSVSAAATPAETSGDETSTRCTLEFFIPPPKNFDGLNNPFANLPSADCTIRSQSSVLFVRPLKTRLSEKDIRITKNGEIKRKRLVRKMKRLQNGIVAGSSSEPFVRNGSFFHTDSTFSLINENQDAAFSLPYSDPKGSVLSYFGIEERVSRGEKYSIRAKRISPTGAVQFLMEWETDRPTST